MLFCVLGQHRVMSRKQQFFFLRKMLSGTDSHFVEEIMKFFTTFGTGALQAFLRLSTQ